MDSGPAYGNEKNTFYNPVKQNATHIYRLSEYLQVKDIFHNVVCFLTNADISHVKAENIYYSYNLPSIKKLATNTLLSVEKMEHYYTKLTQLQEDNATTKKEHIENIHDMQYKISRGICPRCGGMLVLRNGKNGQFYGCSYYPECKFTMNKKEGEK